MSLAASLPARAGRTVLGVFRHMWPPTLYFFIAFSSQHRLTRRQHVRALMELSRLAETTPREHLLDPATPQGNRLVTIVDALRWRPG